jgi:hypothetical protein
LLTTCTTSTSKNANSPSLSVSYTNAPKRCVWKTLPLIFKLITSTQRISFVQTG